MKITEAELVVRKNRIIHTAFQLFCRDGIDRVSIKDVARMADVGEKSVYRYFSTKAELLLATVSMLWIEIENEFINSLGPDYEQKNGLEQIRALMECFRHLSESHANYIMFSYDSRLYLARHNARLTEEAYIQEIQSIKAFYLDAIDKGRTDGSICAEGDSEDLYFAIWGLMRGYVVKIVVYDRMYEGKNIWRGRFNIACDLLLNGLRNSLAPLSSTAPPSPSGNTE